MSTATISLKYQIVIPKEIRERLNLHPGQKVQFILYDNQLMLVPVQPIEESRGMFRGIDTTVDREEDRR